MRGKHTRPSRFSADIPTLVTAFLTAAALLALAVLNVSLWIPELTKLIRGQTGFAEMTAAVTQSLQSDDLWHKDDFVSGKGLFDNLTGRQISNDVVKLKNGMLLSLTTREDIPPKAAGMAEFSELLAEADIPFLYVQTPWKLDLEQTLLPESVEDYALDNTRELLTLLQDYGVDTLDLWSAMCSTSEEVERYFYNTDHHWNNDGAFLGTRLLMEDVNSRYFDGALDLSSLSENCWERTVVKDIMLGSWGRRVGPYYGGTDDLIYLRYTSDDRMSFAAAEKYVHRAGDFEDALINLDALTTRDLYHFDSYALYNGGQYPLEIHRNLDAPNPQRILLIKDSFSQPVIAFLSTLFRELDVIDPRDYEENMAEYALRTKPDLVITMMSPTTIYSEGYFNTGSTLVTEKLTEGLQTQTVLEKDELVVEAADQSNNSAVLCSDLQPGAWYTLTLEDLYFREGSCDFAMLGIYSVSQGRFLWKYYLDAAYAHEYGGVSIPFACPESLPSDARLLIFTGLAGQAQGKGLMLRGVRLEETVFASGARLPVYAQHRTGLSARSNPFNCWSPDCALEPGAVYQIRFEDVSVSGGGGFTIGLANSSVLSSIEMGPEGGSYTVVVPDTPGNYRFVIYSGIAGQADGKQLDIGLLTITRLFAPGGEEVMETQTVEFQARTGYGWNYVRLPAELESGASYTLTADRVLKTAGYTEGATVALYREDTNTTIASQTWTIDSSGSWSFTVPADVPGESCWLVVYSGIMGKTGGVALTYEGLRLVRTEVREGAELVYCSQETQLNAGNNSYYSLILPIELLPGRTYRLASDGVNILAGSAGALTVRLYCVSKETTAQQKNWYTSFGINEQFTIPDDAIGSTDYILQIFAGEPGKTAGMSLKLRNLCVTRLAEAD